MDEAGLSRCFDLLFEASLSALRVNGYDPDAFRAVMVVHPPIRNDTAAGMAEVGGRGMLISGPDAALMHTFVQGMGHLLGLRFASSTFNAYGDGFLDRLGWLPRCRGGSEWPQTDSAVFDVSG